MLNLQQMIIFVTVTEMNGFAQRFPETRYEVESQYMTDLVKEVEQGRFDLYSCRILPDFFRRNII